jgi:hypothetical protein
MIGGSSLGSGWEFSLHRRIQTGSEAHPASYPWVSGALSLDVKLTTHLHLVPRSRMRGLYILSPIRLHDVMLSYEKPFTPAITMQHSAVTENMWGLVMRVIPFQHSSRTSCSWGGGEVPVSILGPEPEYLHWSVSWFSSVPEDSCWDSVIQ